MASHSGVVGREQLSLPGFGVAQQPAAERPRLTISGDLHLRGDNDIDRSGKPDRARPRIRFRVAATLAKPRDVGDILLPCGAGDIQLYEE